MVRVREAANSIGAIRNHAAPHAAPLVVSTGAAAPKLLLTSSRRSTASAIIRSASFSWKSAGRCARPRGLR